MTGLRIFFLLTTTFGGICINIAKGDYYTDADYYEDGKTFFDYADKWYDFGDNDAFLDEQLDNEQGSGREESVPNKDSNQVIPEIVIDDDIYVTPEKITSKPLIIPGIDQEPGTEKQVSNQDSNQIIPGVLPDEDNDAVPDQSDNNTFDPMFILDMEKHLQAEMGRMEDQLLLLHKLISSVFGPQITLNSHDNVDTNSIFVNMPLNQGGIWDYNPFNFGLVPFSSDYTDDLDGSGDDALSPWFEYDYDGDDSWSPWFDGSEDSWNSWFDGGEEVWNPWFDYDYDDDNTLDSWLQDRPRIPNLSDIFELPDDWSNLPSNYSNSTHDIQRVNGSVIAVNETINKQSGDDFNFYSHKKEVHVQPENIVD